MITAIYAASEKTTLTIQTSEELYLEQMGLADHQIKLNSGVNTIDVGPGVFKVRSTKAVNVTADSQKFALNILPLDKDGGPIDPPKALMPGLDLGAVTAFLLDAKSGPPQ